jgi:SAM-dependent methyltransferase
MYERTAQYYDLFDTDAPAALWHADFLARYATLDAHVLDLGSGTGRSALILAERGVRVTCIEPSASMRAIMLGRISDDTTHDALLTLLPDSAEVLHLEPQFEVVAACHMLYLLDDAQLHAVLETARQHLAPGGSFIGDFALRSGRNPHALQQAAERTIGAVTYRKLTASTQINNDLWRMTWVFEAWHGVDCIERVEEHFDVHVRDSAACNALLAVHGFETVHIFGDYSGNPFEDDDSAGRFVFASRQTVSRVS